MITFDSVSKSYRTAAGLKIILRDFSCDLPTDRSIGVLGRNGSGKSALIRLVSGYELPDSGKIRTDLRISFPLAHTGALTATMSGRENARFIARLYGADPNTIVPFVADFSELGYYLDEPLSRYSSSMRARLAFSLCISIPFDVYLIDEISAVGDTEFKRKCVEALSERRRSARIFMVASAPKSMRQYCDRAGILEDGKISFYETMEQAVRVYDAQDSELPTDDVLDDYGAST